MFEPICRRKFTASEEVDDDITLEKRKAGRVAGPRNSSVRSAGVAGDPATSLLPYPLARPLSTGVSLHRWSIDSLKVNKIQPSVRVAGVGLAPVTPTSATRALV